MYFSADEELFLPPRPRRNPACAPARVLLQKERRKPEFQGRLAGIQKSPPQPASLFAPTNVGIDGVPGGIRTHGLSLRRRPLYPAELRELMKLWACPVCPKANTVGSLGRRPLYPAELRKHALVLCHGPGVLSSEARQIVASCKKKSTAAKAAAWAMPPRGPSL